MLPAMTVLHRDIASAILRYRNLRKTGANQKAALNGYDGYQVHVATLEFFMTLLTTLLEFSFLGNLLSLELR